MPTEIASSFPVFGTVQSAGIILGVIVVLGLVFYRWLDWLPKLAKKKLTDEKELVLTKTMILVVMGALFAGGWDVWWHRAVGRDTLWEPPHIFLYAFATIGICLSLYIWQHTNHKIWKRVATALLFVPLSAPFDNFWHAVYGVENLARPISLSWSPPHALLDISIIFALVYLLKALHRHHKAKDESFFGAFVLAAIYCASSFLVWPFHPTEGWGQVAGFWGAGALSAVLIGMLLTAQHWLKNTVAATMTAIFALILIFISYGEETGAGIVIMPHDRVPIWVWIFSYIAAAAILDIGRKHMNIWERALAAGAIWAIIMFVVAIPFFQPAFQYPISEGLKAVVSSMIGAVIAVYIYSYYAQSKE